MPTRNAKISGFGDVWMFDRERVVAADKAEYKDFQRAYGRSMLHDVDGSLREWSYGPGFPSKQRRRDRKNTRGISQTPYRVLESAIEKWEGREDFDVAKQVVIVSNNADPVGHYVLHCVKQSKRRINPSINANE